MNIKRENDCRISNYWVTSDNHFLHSNIIKYCKRPENHHHIMIERWNERVKPDDVVIHCGDFSAGVGSYPNGMKAIKIIASKLNGHKILLRGNHDHKPSYYYKKELWFEDVLDYLIINNIFLGHYPLIIGPKEGAKIKKKKQMHFKIFKKEKCRYVIHGHSHTPTFHKNHFNVATDLHDFYPLSFNDVKKELFS